MGDSARPGTLRRSARPAPPRRPSRCTSGRTPTGSTATRPKFDRIPGYARRHRGGDPARRRAAARTTPVYFDPDPRAPVVAVPSQSRGNGDRQRGTAAPRRRTAKTASDLDARIRELEARIAEDEEALKQLISAPGADADADTEVSPELREIAARLPRLQAELASLRQQTRPQRRALNVEPAVDPPSLTPPLHAVALAGGVGAARFLRGLAFPLRSPTT